MLMAPSGIALLEVAASGPSGNRLRRL